jgi:putative ATP-binding cassette transporter
MSKAKVFYNAARNVRDTMQEGFKGLIFGAYELKLSQHKTKRFIENEVEAPIESSLKAEKKGDVILHVAGNLSEILCFFAIGMVVFLLPKSTGFETQNLYGIVMALLYITGPIAALLSLMQQLKIGEISLEKINKIYTETDNLSNQKSTTKINKDWQKLILNNIKYSYSTDEHSFSIGKVDLSLERGQTYFVVGGNGSGKSTLSKVISLHYLADEGEVCFDEQAVNSDNLASARDRMFVIYSNYYLFNTIYKDLCDTDLALIEKYLKLFKLADKTQLVGDTFTTVKLSDGQRRRLALIVAIVEGRDIFILDEWAADQDPEFKDLYYDFVLPELKRQGKTVIAITHDDRYFSYCDTVIKMENGQVVDIFQPNKTPIAHSA